LFSFISDYEFGSLSLEKINLLKRIKKMIMLY